MSPPTGLSTTMNGDSEGKGDVLDVARDVVCTNGDSEVEGDVLDVARDVVCKVCLWVAGVENKSA